jgi:hypothetical protein
LKAARFLYLEDGGSLSHCHRSHREERGTSKETAPSANFAKKKIKTEEEWKLPNINKKNMK